MKQAILVILGAVVGGALGCLIFYLLMTQRLYGLMIPGALVGIGASYFRCRYLWPSIVSGLLALGLGLIAEWWYSPFVKDASLPYFLQHVHELQPISLLMIVIGAAIGFWSPYSQYRRERGELAAREILGGHGPTTPPVPPPQS